MFFLEGQITRNVLVQDLSSKLGSLFIILHKKTIFNAELFVHFILGKSLSCHSQSIPQLHTIGEKVSVFGTGQPSLGGGGTSVIKRHIGIIIAVMLNSFPTMYAETIIRDAKVTGKPV